MVGCKDIAPTALGRPDRTGDRVEPGRRVTGIGIDAGE